MDMRIFASDVFGSDVESIEDFLICIEKIKKEFSNKENCEGKRLNFQFFYRGDRFCMPTQSNLFRHKLLSKEHQLFEEWQENCDARKEGKCKGNYCGKLMCLAQMQHYKANTRLLDFTEDPLVALRFACGREGENCRKKVTVYCTEQIDLRQNSEEKDNIIEDTMIGLVTSQFPPAVGKDILSKDIFIRVDQDFGRIVRQKGLFLFMGNHYHDDEKKSRYIQEKKIAHELSSTSGRGKLYPGYVGVLTIAKSAVEQIRAELEENEKYAEYKMKYLMDQT